MFGAWPSGKFKTMSCCHLDAIRSAAAEDAGLVFLAPDNLYSDGALARAGALIDQGFRAVLISTLPVLEPGFSLAWRTAFPADATGARVAAGQGARSPGPGPQPPLEPGSWCRGPEASTSAPCCTGPWPERAS